MGKEKEGLSTKSNNNSKRNGTTIVFYIFIVACALAVITAAIIFAVYMVSIIQSPGTISTSDVTTSVCIELLGIFATVVAASYIANIINKADLEKLNQDVSKLKETETIVDELQTTVSEMRPFVDKNKEILFQRFIEALDCTDADYASAVLAQSFRNAHKDGAASANRGALYYELAQLELLCAQIRIRHKSAYSIDNMVIELSAKGKKHVEEIKFLLSKEEVNDQEKELIDEYLSLRLSDLDFYLGYCAKDKVSGSECFLKAAKPVEDYTNFSFYKNAGEDTEKKLTSYFENLIGECYSKVTHYYADLLEGDESLKGINNVAVNIKSITLDNRISGTLNYCIEKISEEAIAHCRNAVDGITADNVSASTYYRNLGCALEREDRIKRRAKKVCPFVHLRKYGTKSELMPNKFANYDEIVESYTKAVQSIKNNYTIKNASAANAYYVLLSYYKKYWDAMNTCDADSATPTCLIAYDESHRFEELVKNMCQVARLAKQDISRDSRLQYLYGFSCAYMLIWIDINGNIGNEYKSALYFKSELKSVVNAMEFYDPNNGFMKSLKKYSESL